MLRLTCILHDYGWATVSIGDDEVVLDIRASYLSDALGDLARAARGVLRGMNETVVRIQDEPGEHRFTFSRESGDVMIHVYRFADTFSRVSAGELLMTVQCPLNEFATSVINCLRHVRDEYGEAGYRERWKNHDFPLAEYGELLELRRSQNRVNDAE